MDDIDPAIAAAMGFSSFGSKRRKHNPRDDNAFVDDSGGRSPGTLDATASTGANNIALGTRTTTTSNVGHVPENHEITGTGVAAEETEENTTISDNAKKRDSWAPGLPAPEELASLRRGVRNARGDMVVFLPSFIENPWKSLE